MEVSSVTWRDWNTGEETDFAEVNCGAFYYDDGVEVGTAATATTTTTSSTTTSSACILGGSGGETIASGVDVEEGCKNALASVCYTVSGLSRIPPVAPGCSLFSVVLSTVSWPFKESIIFKIGETCLC